MKLNSRGDLTTSIICEYSRRDIDSILDGNFKEADSNSVWRELPRDHVPDGVPKNVLIYILISFPFYKSVFEFSVNRMDHYRIRYLSFLRSHVLMNGNIYSSPPMEIAFQISNTSHHSSCYRFY